MSYQIDQLRANFNMMTTSQKAHFINSLRQQLHGVMNEEYSSFLNECVERYNAEVRPEPVMSAVPTVSNIPDIPVIPVIPGEPAIPAESITPVAPQEQVVLEQQPFVAPITPVAPVVNTMPAAPFIPVAPAAPAAPVTTNPAPGKSFMNAVGILYIVFAGIGILSSLLGLSTADGWDITAPLNHIPWSLYYAIALLQGGWLLFVGITGFSHRANPAKGKLIASLAIADIVIFVLLFIGTIVVGYTWGSTVCFFGLTLPILFLVGARKNMKAFQEQNANVPPQQPGGPNF